MAGWDGVLETDDVRWCARAGNGGGDMAEAYEEVGEAAPVNGDVLEDVEFEC